MRLILVRHGQTLANARHINEGQNHGELSELGRDQAEKVARRLKDERIDVILVSDLKRTRDTAAAIIRHHPGVSVVYEPRIREQHLGDLEGTPYGAVSAEAEKRGKDRFSYKPEGGESWLDVRKRVYDTVREISLRNPEKTVLMVTHGGVILNLLIELFHMGSRDWEALNPANTALSVLELDFGRQHRLLTLNCVKHLL